MFSVSPALSNLPLARLFFSSPHSDMVYQFRRKSTGYAYYCLLQYLWCLETSSVREVAAIPVVLSENTYANHVDNTVIDV